MPKVYVHKVDRGIKIGYAADYEKRKKQHATHGDTIVELGIYEFNNKKLDDDLKKILYELGKNIVIPGQSSTEVYSLTPHEAKTICSYVETNQDITKDIVSNILKPTIKFNMITKTLGEYKIKYGNTYVPFKHQRPAQEKQVKALYDYITNSYMKDTFYLTPIILIKNIHEQYEIIDGNHRSLAISRIPNEHPALKQLIHINIKEQETSDKDMILMFRNINSAVPMSQLYMADDYIEDMIEHTTDQLNKIYTFDSIKNEEKTDMFQSFINTSKIAELITRDNINNLIQNDHIKGIEHNDIINFIRDLNTLAYNNIEQKAGFDIFRAELPDEIDNIIEDNVYEYCKEINPRINAKNKAKIKKAIYAIRETISNKNVVVRSGAKKKPIPKKETKEPFVLGLFNIPLYDLYNKLL